ncbi:MAG: phosphate acyltransferase PlsX [Thermodesulfobacteriota bacterium]
MKIAVDAMGGDHAPEVIVQGAVAAAREWSLPLVLVGLEEAVRLELDRIGDWPRDLIEVHHCTEVAGMDEAPVEVLRRKKDSSVRVAFDLVKQGQAEAVVSAGNSGATLAVGTVVLGRIEGIERPGIAGIFPTIKGRTVVMDIGANVDCKPSYLYHFGLMASVYAREALGIQNPKVGLLSIGEEDTKGNELVKRAHELLRAGALNFIGNVEGRDVFAGKADVIVCDGFVGNVVLKLAEGLAEAIAQMLKDELEAGLLSRLGGLLALSGLKRLKKKVDYAEHGGAPLLGIKGVGIISHGLSSPKAIKNAIKCAADMVQADMPARLKENLETAG